VPDVITLFVLAVIILALGFVVGRAFAYLEVALVRAEDARRTKRVLTTIYTTAKEMGVNTDTLLKQVNKTLKSEGLSLTKPE
jgi:hypothetical protein